MQILQPTGNRPVWRRHLLAKGRSTGRLLTIALLLLAALPSLSACARPAVGVDFTTLARGSHSGITAQTAALITDPAAWREHWGRHAALFVPPPPAPPVDFEAASVVVIHLGERRTGGYGVAVTRIDRVQSELRVSAVETRPAPGAVVTMALTQPYHIVRIARVKPGTRLTVEWGEKSTRP